MFRINQEGLVNEEGFVGHWRSLQGRVSAMEFFATIDAHGVGSVSRGMFIEYWRRCKERGVNEDEIFVSLEMIKLQEMWIPFDF